MDRAGLKVGALAGLVGIACCVSPAVLALLGLGSASFAISLGNTLFDQYGWYFRGAALLLAGAGLLAVLRRRRSCPPPGGSSRSRLVVTIAVTMAVVYVALYAVTALLARLAS